MTIANAAAWQIARKIHKTVIRSFQVSIETTSGRVARLAERDRSTRNVRPFDRDSHRWVTAEAKGPPMVLTCSEVAERVIEHFALPRFTGANPT
jgi:hypothetical protein